MIKSFFYYCKTLNESNTDAHKNYLSQTHFNGLGPLLKQVLELVQQAKQSTIKSMNQMKAGHELDEEDMDAIKLKLAKVCTASTYIMEVSGQLVLNFKEQVASMVKANFLNYFALNLNAY